MPVAAAVPVPATMPVPAAAIPVATTAVPGPTPGVASMTTMTAAPATAPSRRGRDQSADEQQPDRHHRSGPQSLLHGVLPGALTWPRRQPHYTPGRRNQSSSAARVLRNARASHGMSGRAKKPTSLTSRVSAWASRPSGTVTWYATMTGVSGYE